MDFINHYDTTQPRRVQPQMAIIPLESRDWVTFQEAHIIPNCGKPLRRLGDIGNRIRRD